MAATTRTWLQPMVGLLGRRAVTIAVGLVGLLLLAAVTARPVGLTLALGQLGDGLFARNFHGDERADGRSYRWSRASSQLVVPGLGGASQLRLEWQLRSGRPGDGPVPLSVLLDGQPVATLTVGAAASQTLEVTRPWPASDQATIELQAPTFRPAGDARDLGVIVDRLTIEPLAAVGAPLAWLERWLRLVALAGAAGLVLWPLRRWLPLAVGLAVGVGLITAVGLVALPWLLAGWPWLLGGLLGLAAVLNQAPLVAGASGLLARLEQRWLALTLVGVIVAAHLAIMTGLAARIEWIGHADYADNAVVARNLVAGRGYSVDYVAQFYKEYGSLRHPADVWPLLQPTLIALSFTVLGVSTFAAKLPNLLVMAALLVAVYWTASRLFNRLAGLLAAGLLALDDWFFQNTLFPVNDVPFSLLVLLAINLADGLFVAAAERRSGLAWRYPALGLVAGLLFVAKPSGLLIALGIGGWWLWQHRPGGPLRWPGWRWPVVALLLATLVATPVIGRSLLTFGTPFYSLQSYDAWVLKWEPPFENIYRLIPGDQLRAGRLLSFGQDRLLTAVGVQFRDFGRDLQAGRFVEVPLLVLAALGLIGGGVAVRRPLLILTWALVPYLLFIQLYWHYELRYFAFLIPWLTLLAAGAVAQLLERVLGEGEAGGRRLALVALALGMIVLVPPRLEGLNTQAAQLISPAGDVVNARWLAANTPAEAVIMTRVPWQISWHSERLTVMLPYAGAAEILATAQRYGADYLLLDRLSDRSLRREGLAPLYEGRETLGLIKVQEFFNDRGERVAVIYRIPRAGGRP